MSPDDPVTLTLLGEPAAFARTGHRGGQHFTPKKQRNAAATLRIMAQTAMTGRTPFEGPLRVDFAAEMAIGKSWSKKRQHAAIIGDERPTKRPDLSNQLKLVEDSLNGVVFKDDAQIVEMRCCKRYSLQPKIIITVSPL